MNTKSFAISSSAISKRNNELEEENKQLKIQIKSLINRVEELESLLNGHGINYKVKQEINNKTTEVEVDNKNIEMSSISSNESAVIINTSIINKEVNNKLTSVILASLEDEEDVNGWG